MRNYALDTKLLPKVWITWASTKNGEFNQRYWLNCQTGKKKTTPEPWMYYDSEVHIDSFPWGVCDKTPCGINYVSTKSDKIWVKNGQNVRYAYAKYHADIERLELAVVGIDTTRKAEPHHWHFVGDRFFIGKDKSILDQHGTRVYSGMRLYEYHTAWNGKVLISMLLRLANIKDFVNEFKKFIGSDIFTIGNGTVVDINNPYHLQRWYETVQKEPNSGKGKQHKLVDDLTAIELSDTTDFAERYPVLEEGRVNRYGYVNRVSGVVYFEKVNDEWDVLRSFVRNTDNNLTEAQRIYINKNGTIRIASNQKTGWIPAKYNYHRYYSNAAYFANKDDAIANCDRIRYALASVTDLSESGLVDYLVNALRFSEIEQIAKLGHVDFVKGIVRSSSVKADLKDSFGGYYNDKEKNILRKVGMTKHQFDVYMSNGSYRKGNALHTMRYLFGNNLSYLDNESFDKYFQGCLDVCATFWRGMEQYVDMLHVEPVRFFKNLVRLSEKRSDAFSIANDTFNQYMGLNAGTAPEIDWYFDDVSDLVRVHDALTELKRAQLAERRARWTMADEERRKKDEEKLKKVDESRKELEYEDDTYIIRLPKDLTEIVQEGSTQHICIGSYTSRHANGETNLFFLRKKDSESVPFYAIEMDNQKNVRQIHGFGNKWLGNDPDAIPTVVRWLRKNGIKCDEKILTCKAHGYGRVNDYVAMPVVD